MLSFISHVKQPKLIAFCTIQSSTIGKHTWRIYDVVNFTLTNFIYLPIIKNPKYFDISSTLSQSAVFHFCRKSISRGAIWEGLRGLLFHFFPFLFFPHSPFPFFSYSSFLLFSFCPFPLFSFFFFSPLLLFSISPFSPILFFPFPLFSFC